MAPRASLSQADKLEKVLAYFHDSATCHTLKDLETAVPAATKINKMQIKDLIKELTDTNQVRVEKIGSGNWYWAWAGEELAGKMQCVAQLEGEKAMLQEAIQDLQIQTSLLRDKQAKDDHHRSEYECLLSEVSMLKDQIKDLTVKYNAWENTLADGVDGKKLAVATDRLQATRATDNIDALESYLQRQLQLSTEEMGTLRKECYGPLWQEESHQNELDKA